MKLLFNKNILKDKSFIKMVCFTIVLIIVLVLGNCFGFVSADEVYILDLGINEDATYWLNSVDYSESDIYDSSLHTGFSFNTDGTNGYEGSSVSAFQSIKANGVSGFPSVDAYSNSIDYSSFDSYLILGNNTLVLYNSATTFIYYVNYSSADRIYAYASDRDNYVLTCTLTPSDNSSYTVQTNTAYFREVYDGYHPSSYATKNWVQVTAYQGYMLSNAPIYCVDGTVANVTDLMDIFINGSGTDTNYMIHDGSVTPSEGSGLGGIGDGETSSNNLYLDDCSFKFTFNPYVESSKGDLLKYKGNWNKGNVQFNAILSDYQVAHSDEFTLHIQFQFLLAGTGFYETDLGTYGTGQSFGGNYTMNTEAIYSLSQFHSSGDSLSWNASDIYDNLFCNDSVLINYNHSLTSLFSQASEFGKINWSGMKIFANAWLTTDSETSSKRIDSFNFLTQTATAVSTGLNENTNPYVEGEEDVTTSLFPEDSISDRVSNSSADGSVTQTVTVNVNGDSDSSGSSSIIEKLINKLLGLDDDEPEYSSAGLTDQFTEATLGNGWMDLLSATFGFVPVSVWSKLTIALTTVLGIMVVAFILRIVLDLL